MKHNSPKKKVLYLSYDGMTDPLGQSQVLPYLTGLCQQGYDIHLISFEKPERFDQHRGHIAEWCSNAGISWHPLTYTSRPPLLSTIYDICRMRKLAFRLHRQHNFFLTHCRSYLPALIGQRMKKKFGTRFLFDMRGFWADERIDGQIWNLKNPIFRTVYKFFKRKEIEFLKEADHVISLTHNGKDELLSWPELKAVPPSVTVIPCCVNLQLFDPAHYSADEKKQLKYELAIPHDAFVLGYVGSIGTWYMLDEMLDYFKELQRIKPTSVFLFITGESPDFIRERAQNKGIQPDKIVVRSCLHQEVPKHISVFDKSIFFIRPSFSKKASSPTKQGEIMAMGIPLVCNAGVGDTDRIVNDYNAGSVIQSFTTEEYVKEITSEQHIDKEQLIRGAHDYFVLEKGTSSYHRIYCLLEKNG